MFLYIKVIYLNDLKNLFGSYKDRYVNIDKGFIGFEILVKFVYDLDFDNIFIILEIFWVDDKFIYD